MCQQAKTTLRRHWIQSQALKNVDGNLSRSTQRSLLRGLRDAESADETVSTTCGRMQLQTSESIRVQTGWLDPTTLECMHPYFIDTRCGNGDAAIFQACMQQNPFRCLDVPTTGGGGGQIVMAGWLAKPVDCKPWQSSMYYCEN
ncbi:hypothetical protein Ae201684P_016332 [Aphanomyces euteiches]|nr:hypothetical protein Ae201684P_016332 [Aphanomyces euteiches]